MKFGRIYSMYVEGRDDSHLINFPLTVRLQINNNSLFSSGTAVFQIYNLAADVRSDLYKDIYEIAVYKQIIFSAGYQQDSSQTGAGGITLPIIFQGNVTQAYSYRQGPDWITEIQALDGGFALDNGSINLTKPTPYSFRDVLADAVAQMPNVKLGIIGAFDFPNTRGITFSGNPWDLITQRILPLAGQAFINKEVVNIIQQWEYLDDEGLLESLSEENGLIGTPKLQSGLVKARMIFEPRLEVGQQIQLSSTIARPGFYKVLQLIHSGTISGAVCETLETEATIFQPDRALEAA